jgi:putative ABC transport system permease protein
MNDKPAQLESVHRGSLWRENFHQALDVIRIHRMRSGLLILGVAIGITTILMMVTVLSGLSRKINKDLVSARRPYVYVQRFDLIVTGENEEEMMRRERLTPEDAEALRVECDVLDEVCYAVQPQRNYEIHYRSKKTPPTQLVGASHTFPMIYSLPLHAGRFFTQLEEQRRARVTLLGYGPASDLFGAENPIGKVVRIGGRRYRVVGTFAKRHHFAGSMSDNFVLVPQTTFRKDFQTKNDFESISATVKEEYSLAEGVEEITNVLRVRRGLGPGEKNNFVVMTSESFLELVRKFTTPVGLVLTVIASIGLVVGGIGVMNIMLISVAERTREIGVRRAIGAGRRDIMQQFLVESSTLTGIGGAIGTVFGTLLAYLVSRLIHFPFQFSVFWTVTALLFSAFVGLVFGLYPARRAAAMDPAGALRYE